MASVTMPALDEDVPPQAQSPQLVNGRAVPARVMLGVVAAAVVVTGVLVLAQTQASGPNEVHAQSDIVEIWWPLAPVVCTVVSALAACLGNGQVSMAVGWIGKVATLLIELYVCIVAWDLTNGLLEKAALAIMQTMSAPWATALFLWGVLVLASSDQVGSNPMGAVLQLLGELSAKLTKDGEREEKAYQEYVEWCDDTSKNTGFAIDTAKKGGAKLTANIAELGSRIATAGTKIEELAGSIASGESELKDATAIREKETAEFAASEAELVDAIDTMSRAIGILSKEMAKNPAAFAQLDTKTTANALKALTAVLDAASFPGQDQVKLMAFVQSKQGEEADDMDMSPPASATYKTHSTGILDVLEDLKEKAEEQLRDLRKAEVNSRHNFDMLRQSLQDQSAADNKDMEDEKAGKASATEAQATAKGDLDVTNKELASAKQQLATAQATCLQVSADHEATVAARKEELRVIAEATKVLQATSTGAVSQTYSLLQVTSLAGLQLRTHSDLVGSEVATAVKRLAKKQHSAELAQLASRIVAVLRFGSSGGDPFAKVKGLIEDMIAKLEKEAGDEATEKAYCDEQMAKTQAKKGELEEDLASRLAERCGDSPDFHRSHRAGPRRSFNLCGVAAGGVSFFIPFIVAPTSRARKQVMLR